MGNALAVSTSEAIVTDDPLLHDYKAATIADYEEARDNFQILQETVGDKMTVTADEFDDIFSLVCQDSLEHFDLFDSWQLGKVDVLEVFAVVIVYCKASVEEKVPLLFDLFDFDHSHEISQDELMLLLLCTSRGLCKVVGLSRPTTDTLEELANEAFARIDRDSSGQISLHEFSDWVLHEPSVVAYLARFAATRVIYDNQVQYDLLLQRICGSFAQFAVDLATSSTAKGSQGFCCSLSTCATIIRRHCPATEDHEVAYLLQIMETTMHRVESRKSKVVTATDAATLAKALVTKSETLNGPELISMEVFCLVMAPYVAFLAADDDKQHSISLSELRVLLWLLRGVEPSALTVNTFMRSLDRDVDGSLSALEWVSYALESDERTGSLSFATQLHLLFTSADRNGDAVLTLEELTEGLTTVFADFLSRVQPQEHEPPAPPSESTWDELTGAQRVIRRRHSQYASISSLVAELASEVMKELDTNLSSRIEWFEFRQHLDFLERRVQETKNFVQQYILGP